MKKKIVLLVVVFLLFVPFRLPIGVLFIESVSWAADLAGGLSDKILAANVVVTKLLYNLALSTVSILNIEKLSIKAKGRRAKDDGLAIGGDTTMYWWSFLIGFLLFCYVIFDTITTYDLYYELNPTI